MSMTHYPSLAAIFTHPGADYEADVERAAAACRLEYPAAARTLEEFANLLPWGDALAVEELFTRTFDVQPITTLDIGYTLFGEDYKRGAMLANLSNEHSRVGNDCCGELGDHLSNMLRLLPKMEDEALRDELVHVLLAPALREMIREFEPERLEKKEELYKKHHKTIIEAAPGEMRTAYRHALEALYDVLQKDFQLSITLPVNQDSKFVVSVAAEMGIESSGPCAAK